MKVSQRYKRILRISFSILYLAGTGYYLTHTFFRVHNQFGDEASPLERYLGPTHLVAAVVFIFILGMIWNYHVEPAIRIHRHRVTGWLFFTLIGLLILSGTAMLYGSEALISFAEKFHPYFGLLLLPTLAIHWNWRHKQSPTQAGHKAEKRIRSMHS
jgi:hypothetical protein